MFRLTGGAGLVIATLSVCGCGGQSGMSAANPITVQLVNSTVTLVQGGSAVSDRIVINSLSETAQVSVTGLPAGVGVSYEASDTNPSGLLTFAATARGTKGTFMPVVSVESAGQQAATSFRLVVLMR